MKREVKQMSFGKIMEEKDIAFKERVEKENLAAVEVAVRLTDGVLSSITESEYEELKTGKTLVFSKLILILDADQKEVKTNVEIRTRTANSIIKNEAEKYIKAQEEEQAKQSAEFQYSYADGGAGNAYKVMVQLRSKK